MEDHKLSACLKRTTLINKSKYIIYNVMEIKWSLGAIVEYDKWSIKRKMSIAQRLLESVNQSNSLLGKKVSLCLLVLAYGALDRRPEGRSLNFFLMPSKWLLAQSPQSLLDKKITVKGYGAQSWSHPKNEFHISINALGLGHSALGEQEHNV